MTIVIIGLVGTAIVSPIVTWLLTRKRVKIDEFTAITDAQNKRIDDLVEQVVNLEAKVSARDDALAAANTENLTLREEVATLKSTVRRYFQAVADAWHSHRPMPLPPKSDLDWLELTIPTAPPPELPAVPQQKGGA